MVWFSLAFILHIFFVKVIDLYCQFLRFFEGAKANACQGGSPETVLKHV